MDWEHYVRSLLALVLVLALIAGVAWAIRRFNLTGMAPRAGRKRRLRIVEILPLDARRKLILVRRDEAEHLLLIGGGADQVIERGIAGFGAELERVEKERP